MVSGLVPSLSYAARRELIERTSPLYREASLAQKGLLLDRTVAVTGYARTYAIRLLNQTLSASTLSTGDGSLGMAPRYGMRFCWPGRRPNISAPNA